MKRLVAVILAVLLLVTLCGCAKKPEGIHIECRGEKVKNLEFILEEEYDDDDFVLTAVLEPEDAEAEIKWESYDEDVAELVDNGDGTATIVPVAPGDTTLLADCGDFDARVKVTVCEPLPKIFDFDALGEAPQYGTPETEFTGPTTKNATKVYCTANDVISSGILGSDKVYKEIFLPHFNKAKTGNANDNFIFSDRATHYEMENSLFTFFATRANGRTVEYVPVYDGEHITGINVNFGDDNISEVTFYTQEVDGKDLITAKISGYGGDQETTDDKNVIGVESKDGGFQITVNSSNEILFRMGNIGESDELNWTAWIYIKASYDKTTYSLSTFRINDPERKSDYWMESDTGGKFTDISYLIQTAPYINGNSCSLSFRDSGITFDLWIVEDSGDIQGITYHYNNDGSYDYGDLFGYIKGEFVFKDLDADGREIKK